MSDPESSDGEQPRTRNRQTRNPAVPTPARAVGLPVFSGHRFNARTVSRIVDDVNGEGKGWTVAWTGPSWRHAFVQRNGRAWRPRNTIPVRKRGVSVSRPNSEKRSSSISSTMRPSR